MSNKKFVHIVLLFALIFSGPYAYSKEPLREGRGSQPVNRVAQQENRDTVPDAVTTSGQFERIVVVRMKQGADLLEGLKSAVEKENLKNAVILSGIGSLVSYHIHVVDNRTYPTENVFIRNDTPVDLTSVNGYIFDGRVHAHINLSDERIALGGHLEPGTEVFTFAIITIGVFNDGVNLERFDDKYWR